MIICHLKDTNKYDCPGGEIEKNEKPLQAAMRELYEETGATKSDCVPLFIYCINSDKGLSYGIQYFCNIVKMEKIPDYEMDMIEFHENIPFEKLKTPEIHKQLFSYINDIMKSGIF